MNIDEDALGSSLPESRGEPGRPPTVGPPDGASPRLRAEVRRALNEAFPLAECRIGSALEETAVDWIAEVLSADDVACELLRSIGIGTDERSVGAG